MAGEFAQAERGDEVVVESHRLRGQRRHGTILAVLGAPEHPYFRVRWADGRESSFHPGNDAVLVPKAPRPRRAEPRPAPAAPRKQVSRERPAGARSAPAAPERAAAASEHPVLRAAAGDRLVIRGHHLGDRRRDAEILEVLGPAGQPPYRIRWSDSGREGILYPGPDALVEHFSRRRRRSSPPR